MNTLILIAALTGHTYMSTDNFTELESMCYQNAMIGYDSVINSRVGVTPEHAIRLTDNKEIRNLIWNAYLWTASPHEYAIKTFTACLQTNDKYKLKLKG